MFWLIIVNVQGEIFSPVLIEWEGNIALNTEGLLGDEFQNLSCCYEYHGCMNVSEFRFICTLDNCA